MENIDSEVWFGLCYSFIIAFIYDLLKHHLRLAMQILETILQLVSIILVTVKGLKI